MASDIAVPLELPPTLGSSVEPTMASVPLEIPLSLSFGGTCRCCGCELEAGSQEVRTNGLFRGYKHCEEHQTDAILHSLVYFHRNKQVKIEDFLKKFALNNLLIPRSDGSFTEGTPTLSQVDRFYFVRYSVSKQIWVINVSFGGDLSKDIKLTDLIHSGIEQSTIDTMIEFLDQGFYSEIIRLLEAQLDVHIV